MRVVGDISSGRGGSHRPPACGQEGRRRPVTGPFAKGPTKRSRMAKGKHSPALFEVVHGKKHVDKVAREGALRTPNWWFKGRQRVAEAGLLPPAPSPAFDPREFEEDDTPEPPAASSSEDPTANASALTLRAREARAAAYQPAETVDAEVVPEPTRHDEPEPDALVIPPALSAPSRGRRSPVQFALDRDRHEMYVRVRYTTAIVAGFTLLVLLALSYITGRNVGRGPSSATASPSAEEIAAGPVETGVFDLAPRSAG